MFTKFLTLCALYGGAASKPLYDVQRSDVVVYSKLNFEKQVTKNRDKGISIVHYYKTGDGKSEGMVNEYQKFATENKGIFRIGSLNCKDFKSLCDKENITEFPTIRIYPSFPAPTQDIAIADKFEQKSIKKVASRFYSDKSIEINSQNHATFVQEDPETPKILLFTNAKKGTPFVYKALSQNFQKTLQFGLIREGEDALKSKYKVKSFPALFVIKAETKPIKFESSEFTYSNIFEFLNVHSQIFVDPSSKDNTPKQSSASKPWLVVPVPQLAKQSGNDICLKKDGTLCIVLVVENKDTLDRENLDSMQAIGQVFSSKISRGITFLFSWVDAETEPDFANVLAAPGKAEEFPRLIILNPGKRKRFLQHQGEINETGIQKTLDKILAGDAKFKAIKGNKLPELVSEYPVEQ